MYVVCRNRYAVALTKVKAQATRRGLTDPRPMHECLNEHWFVSLGDAKTEIERWRVDYNTVRPHSSLDQATPDHFAKITEGARRLTPARLHEEPKLTQTPQISTAER